MDRQGKIKLVGTSKTREMETKGIMPVLLTTIIMIKVTIAAIHLMNLVTFITQGDLDIISNRIFKN